MYVHSRDIGYLLGLYTASNQLLSHFCIGMYAVTHFRSVHLENLLKMLMIWSIIYIKVGKFNVPAQE